MPTPNDQTLTVESLWESYANTVLFPPGFSGSDLSNARRIFYCGVLSTLLLCRDGVGAIDDNEQAIVTLHNLVEECHRFREHIKAGLA